MLISVTQTHINHGAKGIPTSDPVALALEDSGFYAAWVSPSRLRTKSSKYDTWKDYEIPDEVLRFITDFDQDRLVEPFEFELEG